MNGVLCEFSANEWRFCVCFQPMKKFIHECQILQTSTSVFNRLKSGSHTPTNVGTPQSSAIINIECRVTMYASKLLDVKTSNTFV